jgi:hypothetical protein
MVLNNIFLNGYPSTGSLQSYFQRAAYGFPLFRFNKIPMPSASSYIRSDYS